MLKYFYIFFNVANLLLVLYYPAVGQDIPITVKSFETSEILIGATIKCGRNAIGITDHRGHFLLKECDADSIEISYIGFENLRISKADVKNDSTILLYATDALLQMVTVTGSRYSENVSESISSIEFVSRERIERENTPNIEDMVTRINGVQVIDGQANIRGGSGYSYGAGSRVMVLLDDIPILQGDATLANWNDIPSENIEQIEVLKGASSILYGSSAMNGVINLKSGYAKAIPETQVTMQYEFVDGPKIDSMKWWDSPPSTISGSILHKQKFGKLDFVGSVFYLDEDSYFKGQYRSYFRSNLNFKYRIKPNIQAGLNFNFNDGENNSPFYWQDYGKGTYIADTASYSFSEYNRFNLDPYLNIVGKNGLNHKIRARYLRVNNQVQMNRANESNQILGEYQFTKKLLSIQGTLSGGFIYTQLSSKSQLYSNQDYRQRNLGLYTQVEKTFAEKLKVNIGFRYESNKTMTPDSVPYALVNEDLNAYSRTVARLGFNYQLSPISHIRGSWGQGYRYPSIAERFINTNIGLEVVPNPELVPETGWSAEIGYRQGIKIRTVHGYIDLSLYRMEYEDMMEFNVRTFDVAPFIALQSRNIGGTEIQGFEISSGFFWQMYHSSRLELNAGYNYIDPRYKNFDEEISDLNTSNKNILKYRQQHQVKAHLNYNFKSTNIGTTYRYLSRTENIDLIFALPIFIQGVEDFNKDYNNGTHILDVILSHQFSNDLTMRLNMRNALNEIYSLRPALTEAPRSFVLQIIKKWAHD